MRGLVFSCALLLAACDARTTTPDAGTDAGVADGGIEADDAGADAGPACPEHVIAPFSGPAPCSTATAECAAACEDASCAEDCFLADASPQCIGCWDTNQLACWNRNGCQPRFDCLAECITTHCPAADPECIGANCSAEDQAFADCFEPLRQMCLERTVSCLPE